MYKLSRIAKTGTALALVATTTLGLNGCNSEEVDNNISFEEIKREVQSIKNVNLSI